MGASNLKWLRDMNDGGVSTMRATKDRDDRQSDCTSPSFRRRKQERGEGRGGGFCWGAASNTSKPHATCGGGRGTRRPCVCMRELMRTSLLWIHTILLKLLCKVQLLKLVPDN